ncbi:protein LKAAEAR1 [Myotis myotis]|nr:protein LKAAEAR1 [Myotis myotis]
MTGRPPPLARPRMPPPAAKEAGSRDLRERAGKGAQSAESREKRAKGAAAKGPPKPGWALSLEGLEAMSPKQCHRHLLFGDLLEDVGAAASIFPRESAELGYRMPDPRAWAQSLEPSTARQDRLLGVLKAAEARGRVRALRLRYTYMRAEEISLLIQRQKSARAAIRLELFLPPQLKPTRIPDPLDRQERRRVETILEEKVDGRNFLR